MKKIDIKKITEGLPLISFVSSVCLLYIIKTIKINSFSNKVKDFNNQTKEAVIVATDSAYSKFSTQLTDNIKKENLTLTSNIKKENLALIESQFKRIGELETSLHNSNISLITETNQKTNELILKTFQPQLINVLQPKTGGNMSNWLIAIGAISISIISVLVLWDVVPDKIEMSLNKLAEYKLMFSEQFGQVIPWYNCATGTSYLSGFPQHKIITYINNGFARHIVHSNIDPNFEPIELSLFLKKDG